MSHYLYVGQHIDITNRIDDSTLSVHKKIGISKDVYMRTMQLSATKSPLKWRPLAIYEFPSKDIAYACEQLLHGTVGFGGIRSDGECFIDEHNELLDVIEDSIQQLIKMGQDIKIIEINDNLMDKDVAKAVKQKGEETKEFKELWEYLEKRGMNPKPGQDNRTLDIMLPVNGQLCAHINGTTINIGCKHSNLEIRQSRMEPLLSAMEELNIEYEARERGAYTALDIKSKKHYFDIRVIKEEIDNLINIIKHLDKK